MLLQLSLIVAFGTPTTTNNGAKSLAEEELIHLRLFVACNLMTSLALKIVMIKFDKKTWNKRLHQSDIVSIFNELFDTTFTDNV